MNLLILMNPAKHKDYTKILQTIDALGHNLIGFVRNDGVNNFSKNGDYVVYPFAHIQLLNYDVLLLDCYVDNMAELHSHVIKAGVPENKVRTIFWLLQYKMLWKYEDSHDEIIQETLEYWKTHELSIFNQHTEFYEHTRDEMHMDESCGLPYIIFKTVEGQDRRMYYPKQSGIKYPDGKFYIDDVLREQVPTSPHLYIKDNHKINDGDILIDAGVCEGNFALRYIDVCSKIYLCEMDQKWFAPLYFTFRDCWDKVELITKPVGGKTQNGTIALDDVVNVPVGSNIFLKMDIEGAEVDALHGAQRILQNYNLKASVCSYHKPDDCWKIKSIFNRYGYETSTSEGYMIFVDGDVWDSADFRKGIVYANNY